MVVIPNKEWTDFVAEVRSRLDVIDANIKNTKESNEIQHDQFKRDFEELKDFIMGKDAGSLANRVRSLEDTRTKVNGVQLGISAAFSVVTAAISWLVGHPNMHITWNSISNKLYALAEGVGNFFTRKS